MSGDIPRSPPTLSIDILTIIATPSQVLSTLHISAHCGHTVCLLPPALPVICVNLFARIGNLLLLLLTRFIFIYLRLSGKGIHDGSIEPASMQL
jgi:hypothetical protein